MLLGLHGKTNFLLRVGKSECVHSLRRVYVALRWLLAIFKLRSTCATLSSWAWSSSPKRCVLFGKRRFLLFLCPIPRVAPGQG